MQNTFVMKVSARCKSVMNIVTLKGYIFYMGE
jgi:hypothetical protein